MDRVVTYKIVKAEKPDRYYVKDSKGRITNNCDYSLKDAQKMCELLNALFGGRDDTARDN